MHVTVDVPRLVEHDVPREAVFGNNLFELSHRRIDGQRDQLVERDGNVACLLRRELKSGVEGSRRVFERALRRRLLNNRGNLFQREGARSFVTRLHSKQTQDGVGDFVQDEDDGATDSCDENNRARKK